MTMLLLFNRRRVAWSLIGGIAETREVLDFCAEHQIYPECEMIEIDRINDALARLAKGDIEHRSVIDTASLSVDSVASSLPCGAARVRSSAQRRLLDAGGSARRYWNAI